MVLSNIHVPILTCTPAPARLSAPTRNPQLFNVTHFVSVQVNPHIAPFVRKHTSKPFRHERGDNPARDLRNIIRKFEYGLNLDVQARCRRLAKLGLLPRVWNTDISRVFLQK